MKKIITISREFGAGAGEIGKKVAEELGYTFYDKDIILKAASESNVDVESILEWDEKVSVDFRLGQSLFDFYHRPISEKVFAAQEDFIRKIGEKGNCVIVGRNANSILYHFDNSLHVFICADAEWRKNRMLELYPDSTEKQMAEQIVAVDKRRRKYCAYFTDTEFGNPKYYDLCVSTSRLGIDTVKDMIIKLAEK